MGKYIFGDYIPSRGVNTQKDTMSLEISGDHSQSQKRGRERSPTRRQTRLRRDESVSPPSTTRIENSIFVALQDTDYPTIQQFLFLFSLFNVNRRNVTFSTKVFEEIELRSSDVRRRPNELNIFDYDIMRIKVRDSYQRQGYAMEFFKTMMKAAQMDRRGVFLEGNTETSQELGANLVKEDWAVTYRDRSAPNLSFISVHPVPDSAGEFSSGLFGFKWGSYEDFDMFPGREEARKHAEMTKELEMLKTEKEIRDLKKELKK